MTETTTTTQTNIPLSFSTVGNFDLNLNNRSSRRFQSLARNIIGGLNRVYRADRNYRGAMVNNFRNGSIIANCTLTYDTTPTTPSASTVVRQLLNNLENGTNLGNVTLFPSTIRSDGTTVNNLEPISLNISFVIEDEVFNTNLNDMDSVPFTSLRSRVINWLDPVLTSVFGPSTMSNYSVSFSNASTMVQVFTNVQINTTNFANQTMLRDLYIENISASGFDIVISSIQVDGVSLATNRFPLQFRFTNLNFTADLNMRGSPMFRALSANVTNVVNGIFRNNSGFVDIVVNGFASGSVLCDTTISVQPNSISQAALTQMLANNADAFNNANLRLDVNALTNTTTTVAPTTTTVTMTTTPATTIPTVNRPEPPRPFPGFAVAIIVMCSLALLTLPFVIVLCVKSGYCSKMANAFRLESPDNLDLRLPMFGGRSYNFN